MAFKSLPQIASQRGHPEGPLPPGFFRSQLPAQLMIYQRQPHHSVSSRGPLAPAVHTDDLITGMNLHPKNIGSSTETTLARLSASRLRQIALNLEK